MTRCIYLLMLLMVGAPISTAEQPLNVIVFLVDDLGWADLGCYGSSFYETPAIDRLAATGTRLTNAYAACPVCSPTRAALLTGKYPQRTGITDFISPDGSNQPERWKRPTKLLPAPYADRLSLEETTMAELLHNAGYATFFAGKWHLGPEKFWPQDQGFDFNLGGLDQGGPYGGKKYFSPYGNPNLPDGPPGEHLPDRLATETVRFLETHQDQPCFAYLSFYSVHTPLMARADLQKKYEAKATKLQPLTPAWRKIGQRAWRGYQDHAVYAAMVEAMDQAVGKVLQAVDRLKLTHRTLIIFTSDNGGLATSEGHPTTNLPLKAGKGWLYEGGIRVPAIVRWPEVTEPGTVCATPVISMDFLPTLLTAAGMEKNIPADIDGIGLQRVLNSAASIDRPLHWHYPHYGNQGGAPGAAVRLGRWKLIEWYEDSSLELYDLDEDLGETTDLSDAFPEHTKQLHQLIQSWRKQVGGIMPTPNRSLKAND